MASGIMDLEYQFPRVLVTSCYLVLVAIFFNLEDAPANWIWIVFYLSLLVFLLGMVLFAQQARASLR